MERSTSRSVRSAISQSEAEILKAAGLIIFPSSDFLVRITPETGATITQLLSRHSAFVKSATAWSTSASAALSFSTLGPLTIKS